MGPGEFIKSLRKGKAGPAYFLRGPDRFLHEECRAAIIAYLPPESREWCLTEMEFDPGRLEHALDGASQMPMLGGHSFLIFSDPNDFKHAGDDDYDTLQAYLDRPSPFATVVFTASEPDRRRRFTQLLEKKAEVVEMRPLSVSDATKWLEGWLEKAGIAVETAFASEIAKRFEIPSSAGDGKSGGVNLLWLRTEMEKILTAHPGLQRLEPEHLKLLSVFREEHEIGKLLAALADRKFGPALGQLRTLIASKEPETLILWRIGDLIRQALRGATGSSGPASGRGQGAWNRYSNPFATSEIAPRAARNYTRTELAHALRFVRRADLGIKSSWKDSNILLEFLVWQIVTGKESEGLGESAGSLAPVFTEIS